MLNFTFNHIKKDWIFLLEGRQKSPFATINRSLITVPGMDGAYLSSTKVEPFVIQQPIGFIVDDNTHALDLKDELASWLYTEKPVPLQFDDEQGRTYYAVVQNAIEDFEKFAELRQGTIQFLCVDPYGYGEEKNVNFTSDTATIENLGTAESDPIFTLDVLQPTTFAMVSNGEEYMMIGEMLDADDIAFNKEELILHDTCSTTTGWTSAAEVEGGIVAGTMVSDGSSFKATDYGAGTGWHGPSLKKSLSEPLTNFRAEFLIEQVGTYAADVGNVEFYLLDVNNNVVGSIRMRDANTGMQLNEANARVGSFENGHLLIANDYGNRYATWANFSGILRLQRANNRWQAYVALIDDNGNHHSTMTRAFEDTEGLYAADIAQIQVHIATSKEYTPTQQKINDIKIYKLNQREGIPYIADVGDKIIFDHMHDNITINGESIFGEENDIRKDFGADYFKLKSGFNSLTVLPEGAFDTSIKFRERYR
ncbi:distal tail protein Dit [Virgibacillus sp. W0430]|uniref:distal tail protein Dit n=1 Tax=Virgibacillus sp. W0430 TaxID=3391580 RepID=UPI003F483F72